MPAGEGREGRLPPTSGTIMVAWSGREVRSVRVATSPAPPTVKSSSSAAAGAAGTRKPGSHWKERQRAAQCEPIDGPRSAVIGLFGCWGRNRTSKSSDRRRAIDGGRRPRARILGFGIRQRRRFSTMERERTRFQTGSLFYFAPNSTQLNKFFEIRTNPLIRELTPQDLLLGIRSFCLRALLRSIN